MTMTWVLGLVFVFVHPPAEAPVRVMHHLASECEADDLACVAAHDARVASDAIRANDPTSCASSTRRSACEEGVRMAAGEWEPPPVTECIWIARVDREWAWVLHPGKRQVIQKRNRGWRPGQYVGDCAEQGKRSRSLAPDAATASTSGSQLPISDRR